MSVGIATTPTMTKMTNGIKFHKKVSISFKSDVKLKEESLGWSYHYPRHSWCLIIDNLILPVATFDENEQQMAC